MPHETALIATIAAGLLAFILGLAVMGERELLNHGAVALRSCGVRCK